MKYFVISDIHSFSSEMKSALKQAGYKKNDKDSTLIICGDLFDRGNGTIQIYKYLETIPNNRIIYIRGNHEDLFDEAMAKTVPASYDFSNGTVKTICAMSGTGITPEMLFDGFLPTTQISTEVLWKHVVNATKKTDVYKWFSNITWHNYYELDNFIFVHSFIPVKLAEGFESLATQNLHKLPEKVFTYNPDWRKSDWKFARWPCPYKLFSHGCFSGELKAGKTLVCGHWDTWSFKDYFMCNKLDYEIFSCKGLIALDGCTALTHNCNVLVIKDGKCYDKYGNKLKYDEPAAIIETVNV